MNIDDQLKQIKLHNGKSLYEVQLRRSRATALVLAGAAIGSLIFLVFAFVQKAAADQARDQAVQNEKKAQQQEVLAHKLQQELSLCKESK